MAIDTCITMEYPTLSSLLVLLQLMSVIVVVAYLLTRSRIFPEILDGHPTLKTQAVMILLFGALSVYGTLSGIEVAGALVNIRDLGPMLAGLLGGPWVGLGAGLIGAAYRMTLGGYTMYACSLATILAGLFGGFIWLFYRRKFAGTLVAVLFAILMEGFHMVLTLILSTPFEQALVGVSTVAFPMIIANAAGMFVFSFMVENLERERKMQAERDTLLREMERKNTELAIAAEIQKSFLPDTIAQIEGFEIAARSVMAKEVGGDFFDVIPLEVVPLGKGQLGIMIADVSGKGIPAALFMALSRIVVRVNATWYGRRPAAAIRDASTIIANDSKSGMFVTLFYGFLESGTRTLTYVNAGHNPPIHFHAADGSLTELPATGIAMGVLLDAAYTQEIVEMAPGDLLVLYTDGITEAENADREMFGLGRLESIIHASRGSSADELSREILGSVKSFIGDHPQSDDITLMVIRSL
jgi:sigma-B regulation protein RsbU (phosphoserine phosphatase)